MISNFDGKSAGTVCVIKLKDATNFKWDKVYLFSSRIEADSISKIIGFTYSGGDLTGGNTRMVFTVGKKVVYQEDNDSSIISFGYQGKKLTPETAIFEVDKTKDKLESDSADCFYYSFGLIKK